MAQKRKKTTVAKNKKATKRSGKKEVLSKQELKEFKQLLLHKRHEIIGSVNEMKDEALRKSRLDASGDLSSMPIHMADIGTDNYEQEFALGLMDSEVRILREIDAALNRIDINSYGICEGTSKAIKKARLRAKPWARYCVGYAEMIENGQVPEED